MKDSDRSYFMKELEADREKLRILENEKAAIVARIHRLESILRSVKE